MNTINRKETVSSGEMSYKDRLLVELSRNPHLEVAGHINQYNGLEAMQIAHVNIIIGPKKPLYTAEELNHFMLELQNSLQRELFGDVKFYLYNTHDFNTHIEIGWLSIDEAVGKKETSTTIAITDPEILDQGVTDLSPKSKKVQEEKIIRRIFIKVYPTTELAQDVFAYYSDRVAGKTPHNETLSDLNSKITNAQIEELKKRGRPRFNFRNFLGGRS